MFDVGASEMLMIVIVAVVVIGPKDMPMALRTAGRWIGKMRRMSSHFRSGIDAMVREAELEEMERKWREQNEAIMSAHPQLPAGEQGKHDYTSSEHVGSEHIGGGHMGDDMTPPPTSAEAALATLEHHDKAAATHADEDHSAEPQLPLPPP